MDRGLLQSGAASFGILLDEDMLGAFECYAELLIEWNQKMNLTAITQPDEIVIKHFLDSLLLLSAVELPKAAKLIDVGTGAGFPGVPLKICRPDMSLTLLDSLNKRLLFLQELCDKLGLQAQFLHRRAEEGGRDSSLRETFDVATARAVASLRELAEYCLPYVKVGGYFVALKGAKAKEELEEAKKAISLMGGCLEKSNDYTLPDGSQRSILCIRKISQTPTKYPRNAAKMAKAPL